MPHDPPISVTRAVRTIFGTGTVAFTLMGLAVGEDPRWFAAAAVFGGIWWGWDLLVAHVLEPLSDWAGHLFASAGFDAPPTVRPTLDEMIALLERHLERPTSRQVDLNAAIRLEEIYRTVKKDPDRARDVIRRARERYPDAPELRRYGGETGGMNG